MKALYVIFWLHVDMPEVFGQTKPLTVPECADWFKSMRFRWLNDENVCTNRPIYTQGGMCYYVRDAVEDTSDDEEDDTQE